MDNNKEKQEAISWSEKNLVGRSIYNKSIDAKISFTRKGIKHSICARIAPLKIAFIYDLPKLLENAVLFDIQGDRKGRPDIKKIAEVPCCKYTTVSIRL